MLVLEYNKLKQDIIKHSYAGGDCFVNIILFLG
jgi:hypothetical protein